MNITPAKTSTLTLFGIDPRQRGLLGDFARLRLKHKRIRIDARGGLVGKEPRLRIVSACVRGRMAYWNAVFSQQKAKQRPPEPSAATLRMHLDIAWEPTGIRALARPLILSDFPPPKP
jgi:hypothetical protein